MGLSYRIVTDAMWDIGVKEGISEDWTGSFNSLPESQKYIK